ncbi:MAG: alginate export family protein [Acidobacteriota bacterium]
MANIPCPCRWKTHLGAATLLLALVVPATSRATDLGEAITGGKVLLDWRTRYEFVDQDGFTDHAKAFTTRLRLGYQTGTWHGFFLMGELEDNEALGGEQYNSTANGRTGFPVVADPEDSELNQALIGFTGLPDTVLRFGRQRLTFDNLRFIGNVGWRQLEQTYDGFSATTTTIDKVTATYAYINNVNRIFGENNPDPALADQNTEIHLAHVAVDIPFGKLVGYVHLMEFQDAPGTSHRNIGVRYTGETELSAGVTLLYAGEYADQADYKGGAPTIDAEYGLARIGVTVHGVTVRAGYELLGGDGTSAFQTPLATLHAMNGWADQFLVTPPAGLEDLSLQVEGTVRGIRLLGVYHDFSADAGGADYGTEIDLLVSRRFGKLYTAGLKYAAYSTDGFAQDTDKFWIWGQIKF